MSTIIIEGPSGGDDAAAINAALANPDVTEVILGPGVFIVGSAIIIPSGKTLTGDGRDTTMIKAAANFTRIAGVGDGIVSTVPDAANVVLRDFSVDASKLMVGGARLHGVWMQEAENFSITRVDVYNATGYGHFAQGKHLGFNPDGSVRVDYASGTYTDCVTYNCEVGFEQMYSDGITLTNVHGRDGDGDISTEAHFHVLAGSRNITYIDSTSISASYGGFSLLSFANPLENIRIVNSLVEVGNGFAITALGYLPILGLTIENSRFAANALVDGIAARLGGVTGTATNSQFVGYPAGAVFGNSGDGTPSVFQAIDSESVGLTDLAGRSGSYGIGVFSGTVTWDGGTLEARGVPGLMFPTSGTVILQNSVELISLGFDAVAYYAENGASGAIAPGATLPAAGFGSFDGGSLVVSFLSRGTGSDQLGLLAGGGIAVAGGSVSYLGTVIGAVSGGAGGTPLVVTFSGGASLESVQALIRSVGFENLSDDPYTLMRAVDIDVTDSAGHSAKIRSAVMLQASNDAPVIELAPGGAALVLDYTENGSATPIAPDAALTDPDSRDLSGGTLLVELVGHGASDRLTIVGNSEIAVAGSAISYLGTEFAIVVAGLDSAGPLAIAFSGAATPDSVQALLRAIAYHNVSDDPGSAARIVRFLVSDGDGGTSLTAEASIAIAPVDDPAIAQTDSAGTDEDGAIVRGVTGNDDVDGPQPSIAAIAGTEVAPGETVVLPSGARVTLNADGTLRYDPSGAFDHLAGGGEGSDPETGQDSFVYRLDNGSEAAVTIAISGVNDAPGLASGTGAEPAVLDYVENGAPAAVLPGGTVGDVDSVDFAGGSLTTEFAAGGTVDDRLAILASGDGPGQIGIDAGIVSFEGTAIGTVSGGAGTEPLRIDFIAPASPAAVQALLRAIAYHNVSDDPSADPRTLRFTLSDGDGGTSEPLDATILLTPEDDPLVVTDDSASASEDRAIAIAVAANDDPDSPPALIVELGGVAVAPGDTVTLPSGAKVTLNEDGTLRYDPAGSFEALSEPGSDAHADSAIEVFTYHLANGDEAQVTVTVSGVNDAPVLSAPTQAVLAFTEGGEAIALMAGVTLGDVDRPDDFSGGSFELGVGDEGGSLLLGEGSAYRVTQGDGGVLKLVWDGGGGMELTIGEISGLGTATVSVTALGPDVTHERLADLADEFVYHDSSDDPAGGERTITLRLTRPGDGDADSIETSQTLVVTAVNDAPEMDLDPGSDGSNSALAYAEGDGVAAIAPSASFGDIDSFDLASGTLTVAIAAGASVDDRLSIAEGGGIAVADGIVTFGGVEIGSVSGGGAAPLTVTFNPIATSAAAQALLRAISFSNGSDSPVEGQRTISFAVTDGDGGSASAEARITVASVEDAAIAADDLFTTDETTPVADNLFEDNGGGIDRDVDGPALSVAAVNGSVASVGNQLVLASGARLTVRADGSFAYDPAGAFGAVPAPGSGASNTSATDSFSYTLAGGGTAVVTIRIGGLDGDDRLVGTSGDDALNGGSGKDRLEGLDGRDSLDGGTGPDTMEGGLGDDVYHVDESGDVVREAAGQGADTVFSSIGYALAAGAEIEVLAARNALSTDPIALTGNEFGNSITGNAGSNQLRGGGGDDMLSGLGGGDRLDGGDGLDTLAGGLGDDVYLVDRGDRVIEASGEGFDSVYARSSFILAAGVHVEVLATVDYRLTAALDLTGNDFNNAITGNDGANYLRGGGGDDHLKGLLGNDLLDGGDGRDTLEGGAGDDRYIVDSLDRIIEGAGQGYETVYARSSFGLAAGVHVESLATADYRLTITLNLTGNELNNAITGNEGVNSLRGGGGDDYLVALGGNDVLDGGEGTDFLVGGLGDDIYLLDQSDQVIEAAGEGYDVLYARTSYALSAGAAIEALATADYRLVQAIDLTGNELGNAITGNNGANRLSGGGGDDYLRGMDGDDMLDGGAGRDMLEGGAGADVFRFTSASDSPASGGDMIRDFQSGLDRIDLSAIDANRNTAADDAFTLIGSNAFSGRAGELRFDQAGGQFFIYADLDGDAVADLQIAVFGSALIGSDFVL